MLSHDAYAQRAYVFDYDSTIVEDRADKNGIHETAYRLFRINYRGSTFQSPITGPKYIDVSHADYEALTKRKYDPITKHPQNPNFLARAEGKLGDLTPYKLQDGRTFVPGHYMIMGPDTYEMYNEAPEGRNYLEESFAAAYKKQKRGKGTLKGEAFDLYYSLINNPETIKNVFVVSSRGHSYEEVLEKLKNDRNKRKLIESHVTDADLENLAKRHVMLMRQEYQQFDNSMGVPSVAVLKGEYIAEIAKALINMNPADYVMQLDSSGEKNSLGVELFFAEDRYEYIEAVVERLQELVNRRKILKVVIYNAGREEDIELSERAKAYVLTPFSRERILTDQEMKEEFALGTLFGKIKKPKKSRVSAITKCGRYFGGGK